MEPIPMATEVEPYESFRCIGYPAAVWGPDYVTIRGEVRNPAGSLLEGVPTIQLYCREAAANLELSGMSGAPVLVGKDPEVVVGIIRWNPLRPGGTAQAQGRMVFACPIKNVLEEFPALEVYADGGDIVALVKELRPLFGDRLEDRLIHNGAKAHDIVRYLTAKETGDAIATGLRD
jgi:hypothetical protein